MLNKVLLPCHLPVVLLINFILLPVTAEPHQSDPVAGEHAPALSPYCASESDVARLASTLSIQPTHCTNEEGSFSGAGPGCAGGWRGFPIVRSSRSSATRAPRNTTARGGPPPCSHWAVLTTADWRPELCAWARGDWCVVVVADRPEAPDAKPPSACHVLRPSSAPAAPDAPHGPPAAHADAYLFAMARGARYVFATTAEDVAAHPPPPTVPLQDGAATAVDTAAPLLNPHAADFFPTACCPLGTPIADLRNVTGCLWHLRHGSPHTLLSVQHSVGVPAGVPAEDAPLPTFLPHGSLVPLQGPTLFHSSAFWALWLPPSLGAADARAVRGYWLQRVAWEAGARVLAVPRPEFDTPARPLRLGPLDAAAAAAVLCWSPRRATDSVLDKALDLVEHLIRMAVLKPVDRQSFQAWAASLEELGLGDPEFPPPVPDLFGAVMTTGKLTPSKISWYLGTWRAIALLQTYPLMIFLDYPGDAEAEAHIRRVLPDTQVVVYLVQPSFHSGLHFALKNQRGLRVGRHRHKWKDYSGYVWTNTFLGYEMYKHPGLARTRYLLRLDDDVTVKHANRRALGTQPKMGGDLFARMHRDNVTLGWFQGVVPFRNSGGTGVYRDMAAFACSPQRRFPASPLYGARPALTAGCYEMYHLSVYQNQHYMDFVGFMRVWYWVASFWHEQDWKSAWHMVYVQPPQWRFYGCALGFFHKNSTQWNYADAFPQTCRAPQFYEHLGYPLPWLPNMTQQYHYRPRNPCKFPFPPTEV